MLKVLNTISISLLSTYNPSEISVENQNICETNSGFSIFSTISLLKGRPG